jgi:Tol biopolymer transport system component
LSLNPELPSRLGEIIDKALEKDREVRCQTASELRADLKRLKRDTDSGRAATAAAVAEPLIKSVKIDKAARKWKWALAGLVFMLLIGSGVIWFAKRGVQPQPPKELKETGLTANPSEYGVGLGFISPDGKYLAYNDRRGLYLMLIETRERRNIPQPKGSTAENPDWWASYWFPDGTRFLATRFDAAGNYSTWVVSVLGGPPRRLRDHAQCGIPSPDGDQIVYLAGTMIGHNTTELWLMGAQGENPRKFLTAPEGESLNWQIWSPDGQRVAYLRYHGGEVSIESRDLNGERLATILSDPRFSATGLWWFPNGRMVFTAMEPEPNQKDCSLWEIQVEPKTGRSLGPPRRIVKWPGIYVEVHNGTTDSKRLAVSKASVQTDVFVGELEARGRRLKNPRRLTLDEHYDFPSAWTTDGKAVFFHSDRNVKFDIFKQALDQETAETVVTGPGNKHDAVLSPDGNLILYLQDADDGKTRIMRVPLSGGAPEMVLEGKGINDLKCSWSPATLCVLGEETPDRKQLIFTALDPLKGRGRELTRITLKQPIEGYFWDLARDGSRLAFAQEQRGSQRRIQILPISAGETQEVVIQRDIQMTSLDWANDGKGFFVGSCTPEGVLLFVDMHGRTEALWKRETLFGFGPRGLPSPDGRHLAMLGWTVDSNVWMLENF